ncbi:WXG100 family type VII secretion target [Glycomyces algeriensis]|uniref:PPE family protein n=1 Tax=Glycomyces algeriensis TaxID=256037 RepID=A0A9W6G8P4_9ACTN|nr:hypothetical protein [Glycomyces algeriensis]MDA1365311.1 hypothetical protein [Glycomyces algeriensis]MDR7349625.1 uncharacterized protein YukE [Glycomyces algeriensis]GLI42332.1 hypothetical protein GALLR39Z86_21820 [Glycomyces algeriensis]
MTDSSLVAPVQSSRKAWTGAGLADSVQDVVESIESEGWVDDMLAGGGLALEVAGSVLDPFSALLSNGLGWAMEYFEPLREMLDELTGKADVVMAHASTWTNMSGELYSLCEDLQTSLGGELPTWTGDASDSYQSLMSNNVDAIGGLGATAAAMAAATQGAGALVQLTRDIVRDLIAELVGHVVVWAVEAIFVVTIPVIAVQIVAAVVKWGGIILGYGMALVQSLQNLKKLLGL